MASASRNAQTRFVKEQAVLGRPQLSNYSNESEINKFLPTGSQPILLMSANGVGAERIPSEFSSHNNATR
jgi:hypothetical protein